MLLIHDACEKRPINVSKYLIAIISDSICVSFDECKTQINIRLLIRVFIVSCETNCIMYDINLNFISVRFGWIESDNS